MKQSKKITRTQRSLLQKAGYQGDTYTCRVIEETVDYIVFEDANGVRAIYNKIYQQFEQ